MELSRRVFARDLPAQTARAGSTNRILYLDGLRGLAALMVVVFHYWVAAGEPDLAASVAGIGIDLLAPIRCLGGARVSLFFVLSGFLLYLPFARNAGKRVSLARWLWERFRRVAPPYYAALLLALMPALAPYYAKEAWLWISRQPPRPIQMGTALSDFPACLFFAHGLVPGRQNPAINEPLWTMTPEIELYLTFPLLVYLARQKRLGGLAVTVAFATGLSVLYRLYLFETVGSALSAVGGDAESARFLKDAYHCLANTFLGRWAEFALGMGVAGLVSAGRTPPPWLSAASCAGFFCLFLALRNGLAGATALSALADLAGGAAFSALILCCATIPRAARLLSTRPLACVGVFAYSLYLVHIPVLGLAQRLFRAALPHYVGAAGLQTLGCYLLAVLPAALGAAWLFWRCFERPFLSHARRAFLTRRPRVIDMDRLPVADTAFRLGSAKSLGNL